MVDDVEVVEVSGEVAGPAGVAMSGGVLAVANVTIPCVVAILELQVIRR